MKKINLFLVIVLTLCACGKNNIKSDDDDTVVGAFEKLDPSANRVLNSKEQQFVRDICDAVESNKEFLYRSVGEVFKFNFSRDFRSCSQALRPLTGHSVQFSSPLNINAPLVYTPVSGGEVDGFIYDIFTDEHYVISKLCKGEDLNLIQDISNGFVKFRFYAAGIFEYFIYSKNGDQYFSTRFESIKVNLNSASNLFGMVENRITGGYCKDGSQTFYVNSMK